ncbi:hypothetical protein TNIN_5361 [Trichonephila inaurata madagascariensis]|uniref:Uncharacterized protein n=1 Tax=Trichonephila inaurata madagascariensis TaxID=2747483 RepID=A0A8X7CU01_9ARAC|nr:hypothetical protein TNIN_5361 [Trichonephila inaurata madagascariensis]
MSCPYNYTASLLKVLEVVRECNDRDVEENTQSLVPHQSDVPVPDQGLSFQDHQTPTSERENECSNIAQNSAETDDQLNRDTLVPETPRSTNPMFPHYATSTTSTVLKCSFESLKSSDSVLKSRNKIFGSETASTSTFTTPEEIQHSNVLRSDSSILNENTSSASEKYPHIVAGTRSANLDICNPSVSGPVHVEKHEIPVRKLVGPSRSQFEGRKRQNEKTEISVMPDQRRAITKSGSRFFENPPKTDPKVQFPFQSNPSSDPYLPLAFQKPFFLQQTKSLEETGELSSTNRTKKHDPRYPLTRSSALHPFGSSAMPCKEYNNAAWGPDVYTAGQLHSFESGNYNRHYHGAQYSKSEIPEAQRGLQRSSTLNPSRWRSVDSEEPHYPFKRRGIPEVVRYSMPKTSESCSLGAHNFNSTYHRAKCPRGGSSAVQRRRYEGVGTAQDQLNALPFTSRSYASVVASNININWAPSIRGKILESRRLMLKPSSIPSLPKETFDRICREGIICEDNGCFYMIFKVNTQFTHGREYHIKYVTSQNLDGTCNFSSDDNGRPTAGVTCRHYRPHSSTQAIIEWLMSLPRPEDMDKIR